MCIMMSVWAMVLFLTGDFVCSFGEKTETAKEGSCVTIGFIMDKIKTPGYIVCLKNSVWNEAAKDFNGTVVCNRKDDKPVASEFENRVSVVSKYRTTYDLTINNLTQQDSGSYSIRYYAERNSPHTGPVKSDEVKLEVVKNPCRVSVTGPEQVVLIGDSVSLLCSTSGPCDDRPTWHSSATGWKSWDHSGTQSVKTVQLSFTAHWSHDGTTFTCSPPQSKDSCESRSITLTVEHKPIDTMVSIDHASVTEGGDVTFTCQSKGNPQPKFLWFKDGRDQPDKAGEREWKLSNVRPEHAGGYYCRAENKLGGHTSAAVKLDVKYSPRGVKISSGKSLDRITEGDEVSLTCNVQSSNPKVLYYFWYRDRASLGLTAQVHRFKAIPEHTGFYHCRASNSVGSEDSPEVHITVYYGPRRTDIKASCCERGVKAGQSLTLTCSTDARPEPYKYTWFHAVTRTGGARNRSWAEVQAGFSGSLSWWQIHASNAGEYMCQATNIITAQNSTTLHVHVLYGPTGLTLSMDPMVRESSVVTIHCTVESYPPSTLTLTWAPISNPPPDLHSKTLLGPFTADSVRANITTSFIASVEDTGLYACRAQNSEGQNETSRGLVVHYAPRDVRVTANPRGELSEKENLNLSCEARSSPNVTTFTWFRLWGGRAGQVGQSSPVLFLRKLSEVDAGHYFCRTQNDIGEGNSSVINVTVKYGPRKPVIIHNMSSRGQTVEGRAVALMCSSQSYPPIQSYKWYRLKDDNTEIFFSDKQNLTTGPDQGGLYYCMVDNGISSRSSDKIEILSHRSSTHILILAILCLFLIVFIIIVILIVVHRKRKKSTQRSLQNASRNGTWEMLVMDGMGDPHRSRESLSAVVAPPLNPQTNQHGPDNIPSSSVHTVYSALKISGKTQQMSLQGKPPGPAHQNGGGSTEEITANYALLQFPGKRNRKDRKLEESTECVYSKVSKPKRNEKEEEEEEAEYENVKGAAPRQRAGKTNEEDADVCYSTVSIAAQPGPRGPRRARCHSDSSDEDDYKTQYSQIKA